MDEVEVRVRGLWVKGTVKGFTLRDRGGDRAKESMVWVSVPQGTRVVPRLVRYNHVRTPEVTNG
jgi:hypothetical protein